MEMNMYRICVDLERQLGDKDYDRPDVSGYINWVGGQPYCVRVGYGPSRDETTHYFHSESFEESAELAEAYIEGLPTGRSIREQAFLGQLAAVIESARDLGIPLETNFETLHERLLTCA